MFVPGHRPSAGETERRYIVLSEGKLLSTTADQWQLFSHQHWQSINPQSGATELCIGEVSGSDCFAIWLDDCPEINEYEWVDVRRLMPCLTPVSYEMIARAKQMLQWQQDHRYCGRCGAETELHHREMATHCGACDLFFYPRISPCVIMLVTRGEYCLLAHNAQFPGRFYSALAGFVEAGETLEAAVRREVMEEVGISVGATHYFGSQPWPFPSQMMIGFHAEYESGEIRVDGVEIDDADWFHWSQLPEVPGEFAIAGQLISHFVKVHR